jgi:hypothetical protein
MYVCIGSMRRTLQSTKAMKAHIGVELHAFLGGQLYFPVSVDQDAVEVPELVSALCT